MTASLRNAVSRRTFKERAQPKEREKLGLLEKRKDYILRAKDFKQKTQKLKALKEKARDRNPDEFSFAMMSTKTNRGIKIADRGNEALSVDVVRLLKTQDSAYIRTTLQQTNKEIEKIERSAGGIAIRGDVAKGTDTIKTFAGNTAEDAKHIIFVEDQDEKKKFDLGAWKEEQLDEEEESDYRPSDEEPDEADRPVPRYLSVRQREEALAKKKAKYDELKRRRKAQQALRVKLQDLYKRKEALESAARELDEQRNKMGKKPLSGVTKKGVKFRVRERRK